MRIESNGDISFYEDTGTTPKFFWDASAGSLGIGTTSPTFYEGSGVEIERAGTATLRLQNTSTSKSAEIKIDSDLILETINTGSVVKINTGATERMRIDSSGQVGIGTSSPAAELEVVGTGDVNGAVLIVDDAGSLGVEIQSTSPTILFNEDDTTDQNYQIRLSSGTLNFQTQNDARNAAATKMTLDASGNVGIGTSSPGDKLHISGSGLVTLKVESTDDSNAQIHLRNVGSTDQFITAQNGELLFEQGSNEAMRIDASGRVGIGTSTPLEFNTSGSANARLLTVYNSGTNSGTRGEIQVGSAATTDGQFVGGIVFGSGASTTTANGISAIYGVTDGDNTTLGQGELHFFTAASGSNTERMRIDSSGNVGIGTSSPKTTLNVSANNSGQGAILTIENADTSITTNDVIGQIDFYSNDASPNGSGAKVNIKAIATSSVGTATALTFGTSDLTSATAVEAMRIDASGNLLVGKTSAAYNTDGFEARPNGETYVSRSGTPMAINRNSSDGALLNFYKDGTTVGVIGADSGDLYIGTGDTGVRFRDAGDDILPFNTSSGADRDAAIDLGDASSRFKDLYLSGGVYLGGTGAANLLDDYEEGLHTATLTPSTSGSITLSNDALAYTKIGRVVHLQGRLTVTSVSSPTGSINLSLPFAIANTSEDSARTVGYVQIQNATSNLNEFGFSATESGSVIALIVTGGNTSEPTGATAMAAEFSGNELVAINLTYITT